MHYFLTLLKKINYLRKKVAAQRFIQHLENVQSISPIHQLFLSNISTIRPHTDIIKQADQACQHIFSFLGLPSVHAGTKIDWHKDFRTNFRWDPQLFYLDVKIPYGQADIRIPWELSRFNHAVTLGQAYWLTNDEKYTDEFMSQISDWIENNKVFFGVNWTCTMDVAIRACNWLAGFHFFRNSKKITNDFLQKFLKSLYSHGSYIWSNLEFNPKLTSNHYLSNLTGLAYLGTLLPGFKKAKKWRDFAIQELIKEIDKQVYNDGCDFEASTCYHRLALELFFYPTLLAVVHDPAFNDTNFKEVSNKIFSPKYTAKLHKMFEAVLYLLKPNGQMPQIGDNDDGRLHTFMNSNILDMRYLLNFGAIFFQEPRFKIKEFGLCEEALWIFNEAGIKTWEQLEENTMASVGSRAFKDAGWYVMRSNRNYFLVVCGPNGQKGNGGHAHNDKLSFELHFDGKDIIIDAGTCTYTSDPKKRNELRSTASHNTVLVDKEEQNSFILDDLFKLKDNAHAKMIQWETNNISDRFIGEHYGYQKLSAPVIHQREIKFYKTASKVEIHDRFFSQGRHELTWGLLFAADIANPMSYISSEQLKWEKDRAWYSPHYGRQLETVKLTATKTIEQSSEFKFHFHQPLGDCQ